MPLTDALPPLCGSTTSALFSKYTVERLQNYTRAGRINHGSSGFSGSQSFSRLFGPVCAWDCTCGATLLAWRGRKRVVQARNLCGQPAPRSAITSEQEAARYSRLGKGSFSIWQKWRTHDDALLSLPRTPLPSPKSGKVMALLPYGCGVNRSGRDGGVRLVKQLGAHFGRPQSTSKLVLLGESRRTHGRRNIWGSARQYYAQAVASTGVSPTVCTTRTAEGGNVTPNAIGPSAQINRNSLPSREQRQIPPIHIDAETSYSSKASHSRSILAHSPAYTHHTKATPLLSASHHIRSTTFVKALLPTQAHIRRHHTYQDVLKNNNKIIVRAQGDTWRDLVIRHSPIQTLDDQHLSQFSVNPFTMSAPQPQKEQPGSPELAPPPSEFSLGGVKSNLDTLVRGNKPESLNIDKEETAKSEEELRKGSGIMSPSITINEKEEEFIGSVDQGTTSSRFIIFNSQGEPVASHQLEFDNIYPQSG